MVLDIARRGTVLVLTMNRPERRNALDRRLYRELGQAFVAAEDDDAVRAVVLTGAGDQAFCAGMDLKAFARGENVAAEGRGLGFTERPPLKPLIAAVEGYALAGGFELALACDLIVAAETSKFGLPEVKRGLVANAGGLVRLPRQLPYRIALELVLTGAMVPAAEMHARGLINRIVPQGQALEAARELARAISENGPMAVAVSKQVMREQQDWPSSEMFQRQDVLTQPIFKSADAQEGARAFAEKRKPVWTGK
jgi:enoyl-CoA hydratase